IRYKKGLGSYFFIFYIVAAVVSLVIQQIYIDVHKINYEILQNIITSGDYFHYLEEFPVTTVQIIQMLSLTNFVVYSILVITLLYVLKKDFIEDAVIFKREALNKTIKTLIIYSIIFITLNYSINYIIYLIQGLIGYDSSSTNQIFIEVALSKATILTVISTVILGPIAEELIFRKCFFGLIKNKKLALLASSLVFGFIHIISSIGSFDFLETIMLLIPYITAGILLGLIYIKTKLNIYYVTIIHILVNLISIILILI
ncbi:MAG: CPBP family intramembrane glutamic endopeptidase, partial [Peptostreptococcaceae bacterium]